jgi:alkylated DNA repair dioxygenase AlkB
MGLLFWLLLIKHLWLQGVRAGNGRSVQIPPTSNFKLITIVLCYLFFGLSNPSHTVFFEPFYLCELADQSSVLCTIDVIVEMLARSRRVFLSNRPLYSIPHHVTKTIMSKRTLDTFFSPSQKKVKISLTESKDAPSNHSTYPFGIPQLPPEITDLLNFAPEAEGKAINDQPDLDLLYFQPYIPASISTPLFEFLRGELFFYRVKYKIKRGPIETAINTPRFTTVFGVDETSSFAPEGSLIDASTKKPIAKDRYKTCKPRPIPHCLDLLRKLTEAATDQHYNFCLVNYYATGDDSISYHSDDERFLGVDPAIASFSLGAKRDFLLKHKPTPPSDTKTAAAIASETKPLKLPLGSGDMVLMRGSTQSKWLHSIPKRKGGESGNGRINITFRRAMVAGGTENYYRYNVGDGDVMKWDGKSKGMVVWGEKKGDAEAGKLEVKAEDVDKGYAGL